MLKLPKRQRRTGWSHALLQQPATTMPELPQPDALRRRPDGPPVEGLQRLQQVLQNLGSTGLCLVTHLADRQHHRDATAWFSGAASYIERVVSLMDDLPRVLPKHAALIEGLPFTADDLGTRLQRVRLLEEVAAQIESLLLRVKRTLLIERADLVRLADVALAEVELLRSRPTLDPDTLQALDGLAEVPLNTWRRWLARVQQTKKKNAQLRGA